MHNRKLTLEHLERGQSRKAFSRLQHFAGLQEHGKKRVDEAMKAALAHVQKNMICSSGSRISTLMRFCTS